jgi:hypothetical protein
MITQLDAPRFQYRRERTGISAPESYAMALLAQFGGSRVATMAAPKNRDLHV